MHFLEFPLLLVISVDQILNSCSFIVIHFLLSIYYWLCKMWTSTWRDITWLVFCKKSANWSNIFWRISTSSDHIKRKDQGRSWTSLLLLSGTSLLILSGTSLLILSGIHQPSLNLYLIGSIQYNKAIFRFQTCYLFSIA